MWIVVVIAIIALFTIQINYEESTSVPRDTLPEREYLDFGTNNYSSAVLRERMLKPVVKLTMIQVLSGNDSGDASIAIPVANATGVSIKYEEYSNTTLILSNDHFCKEYFSNPGMIIVAEDSSKPRIGNVDEDSFHVAEVIKTDSSLDLCLMSVKAFIPPAIISRDDVKYNQFNEIYIIGGPTGIFPVILKTYTSGYIPRDEVTLSGLSSSGNDFLFLSGIIFPGHSGSPVYNSNHEMIGIIFASLPSYGALAIPTNDIYNFLEQ